MAWLYQRPDSERWWIGWRANGRQFLKSTGTSDKKEAEKKLHEHQFIEQAYHSGKLTAQFIESITGTAQHQVALKSATRDFLNECKGSTASGTLEKYTSTVEGFLASIGATDVRPLLRDVTPDDVRAYLTKRRAVRSASTANLDRKVLSIFFRWTIRNQMLRDNPVMPVARFKDDSDAATRRAFTLAELQTIYAKAPNDFWRYMVLGGFYSGLRMGDLITLKLGEIDFPENALRLTTGKTKRRMIIPMAQPLRSLLNEITASVPMNNPARYLWPEQSARYEEIGARVFSAEFYDLILTPCGLAAHRSHKKQKNGRSAKRELTSVSFHCLRHSFVTFLKVSGGSQVIAKELAGHSSDLVNNLYTHLPQQALADAINKLPKVE
jgi:integrase